MPDMKMIVDCSAPNKERELAVAQASVEALFDLVRAEKLKPEDAEAKVADLLAYATEVVAAPDQVRYVELDADDLAQRELDLAQARVSAAAQLERDSADRLRACDWTQLPDAGLDDASRKAWTAYRQALRDLPAKTADPFNPDWPKPPA